MLELSQNTSSVVSGWFCGWKSWMRALPITSGKRVSNTLFSVTMPESSAMAKVTALITDPSS